VVSFGSSVSCARAKKPEKARRKIIEHVMNKFFFIVAPVET